MATKQVNFLPCRIFQHQQGLQFSWKKWYRHCKMRNKSEDIYVTHLKPKYFEIIKKRTGSAENRKYKITVTDGETIEI